VISKNCKRIYWRSPQPQGETSVLTARCTEVQLGSKLPARLPAHKERLTTPPRTGKTTDEKLLPDCTTDGSMKHSVSKVTRSACLTMSLLPPKPRKREQWLTILGLQKSTSPLKLRTIKTVEGCRDIDVLFAITFGPIDHASRRKHFEFLDQNSVLTGTRVAR
jgi:hypothetical protein